MLTRREFVVTALQAAAVTAGCSRVARDGSAAPAGPRISARPGAPPTTLAPGLATLGDDAERPDALLFVPAADRMASPVTLLVALHGAGGQATRRMAFLRPWAEEFGFLLLVPQSRGPTWDAIRGPYGHDVRVIDRAMRAVFAGAAVAPERVFVEGFSDGASYALGLGISNGDLFRRIVAFSPGMVTEPEPVGRPEILVTHGTADQVLPIEQASRAIVPLLRRARYVVEYREHPGGHTVPPDVAREALTWLMRP